MKIRLMNFAEILLSIVLTTSCSTGNQASIEQKTEQKKIPESIHLSSGAFPDGSAIPAEYTCDGKNISPSLKWTDVPGGTKSLVLICDDPDAPSGTWTHWVLFDIPANVSELPEGISATEQVLEKAKHGINDFNKVGYGGPCPPPGNAHHYHFKLYALDGELNLNPRAAKDRVMSAMKGHILAEGQLIGTYKK